MSWVFEKSDFISMDRLKELMEMTVEESKKNICSNPKRVLLLPPDLTRAHSGAGKLTEILYTLLKNDADVHLIPTLGQHVPHTPKENRWMFGSIPEENIHVHDWRNGCVKIGEVPAEYVREVSAGKADWPIPIVLNKMLIEEKWDLIINIGHVVPHEVLGFANHNKNYFIGLGGKETICASHIMAACCGIENNLGNLVTPMRACFNKAEADYLNHLPDVYVQIVMAYNDQEQLVHTGLYVGDGIDTYLEAARQSREQNIIILEKPVKKLICFMQADEFRSTWVANKAIYRTRMAMANGGELLIIAPGLERFGEQPDVDMLIRKYGYRGTPYVMQSYKTNKDMQDLAHATAHLIHGSSEGRFTITYAPGKLSREEIEGVNFEYADLSETLNRYNPDKMKEGWSIMADGEEVYYISSPATGLWALKNQLTNT